MLEFDYEVIRRPRRKTASISVKPDNGVVIVVPSNLPQERIEKIIKSKARWIQSKLRFNEEVQERCKPKEYVSGESFSYLGRNYRLKFIEEDIEEGDKPARLKQGHLIIYTPESGYREQYILEEITSWYQEHALKRLQEKTERYARSLGVMPFEIGLKSYKSRWGSCHKDGRIYFNWRIIMAPHSVMDYVVVHELCHLIHHNHSAEYWKLVESILPDYRETKAWLKANGQSLDV